MAEPKQPKPENKPVETPKISNEPKVVETSGGDSNTKTSGLAIAALILAFVFPLIGLILGIVALVSIKKSGEKGKGFAIAGIVISSLIMLFSILLFAVILGGAFKAAKDNGVNIDAQSGNFSVTNKEGDTATVGSNAKLPEGFPSDVPIYEPSDIIASVKTGEGGYSVSLLTGDSLSEVNDFYSSELKKNGWSSSDDSAQYNFSSGSISTFTKGNQTLGVLIATDAASTNGKKTSVTLTVANNN